MSIENELELAANNYDDRFPMCDSGLPPSFRRGRLFTATDYKASRHFAVNEPPMLDARSFVARDAAQAASPSRCARRKAVE